MRSRLHKKSPHKLEELNIICALKLSMSFNLLVCRAPANMSTACSLELLCVVQFAMSVYAVVGRTYRTVNENDEVCQSPLKLSPMGATKLF